MPKAPICLDTSTPDWRRQFRGITVCKGETCKARIGWVIHIDDQGRERKVPYNDVDGRIHHSTCPDVESFKRAKREGRVAAVPQCVQPKPEPKAAPSQSSLFSTSTLYRVD